MEQLATRKHFTIAAKWDERTIEQWLEQYGSWLLLDGNYNCFLGSRSTLSSLIDNENGVSFDGRRRALPRCNISVYEAMAVEDLLAHIQEVESKKVIQWMKVVVMYFVDGAPEETIARKLDMTMYAVKRDKTMGIIRLATRFKMRSYLTD